jgi:hypothetical protein
MRKGRECGGGLRYGWREKTKQKGKRLLYTGQSLPFSCSWSPFRVCVTLSSLDEWWPVNRLGIGPLQQLETLPFRSRALTQPQALLESEKSIRSSNSFFRIKDPELIRISAIFYALETSFTNANFLSSNPTASPPASDPEDNHCHEAVSSPPPILPPHTPCPSAASSAAAAPVAKTPPPPPPPKYPPLSPAAHQPPAPSTAQNPAR